MERAGAEQVGAARGGGSGLGSCRRLAQGLTGRRSSSGLGCMEPTVVLWRRRHAERGNRWGRTTRRAPAGPGVGVLTPAGDRLGAGRHRPDHPRRRRRGAQGVTHGRRRLRMVGSASWIAISHDRIATLCEFCCSHIGWRGSVSTDRADAKTAVVGIDPSRGCRGGLRRREEPNPGLDRTQPVLPMRPGRPNSRPTTTSGTAPRHRSPQLEIATGQVVDACKPRHRSPGVPRLPPPSRQGPNPRAPVCTWSCDD